MNKVKIHAFEYYNKPHLYRFIPRNIFNSLQKSVLNSNKTFKEITCEVPESDFIRMINEIAINNGSQSN